MLKIYVEPMELFDNNKNEFIDFKGGELVLEHSLVSIAKWESKWHKPFLAKEQKSDEEMVDYVRCMTVSKPNDPSIYYSLSVSNLNEIQAYIDNPMTATTINDRRKGPAGRQPRITSELIYYWMISFNIPVEFEKWHLNRLLTLIRVCDIKNSANDKASKMSKRDAISSQRAINAANKARLGTRG